MCWPGDYYPGIFIKPMYFLSLVLLIAAIAFTACTGKTTNEQSPTEVPNQTSPAPGQNQYTVSPPLADPEVKEWIRLLNESFVTSHGLPAGDIGEMGVGYVGAPGNYTEVRIDNNTGLTGIVIATIDTASRKVMAILYRDFREPQCANFTIPPFSYAYVQYSPWYPSYDIKVDFSPNDSSVYPLLINRSELSMLVNGSGYEAYAFFSRNLNRTVCYDGSTPVESGWTEHVYWQMFGDSVIPVLKNNGSREVNVSLKL